MLFFIKIIIPIFIILKQKSTLVLEKTENHFLIYIRKLLVKRGGYAEPKVFLSKYHKK